MMRRIFDNPPSRTEKCIVLDLDECLLHTLDKGVPLPLEVRGRSFKITLSENNNPDKLFTLTVVERPGLREFLRFAFGYFQCVGVWSAGEYSYVHEIVKKLFREYKPAFVLTGDDIKKPSGEDNVCRYYKPLDVVFSRYSSYTPRNTLFLDDRESNFQEHYRNGIVIPRYDPEETRIDIADDRLQQLTRWLKTEEVTSCPDVRNINKSRIFTPEVDLVMKLLRR